MLETERAYFDAHRSEWLQSHHGQFALIKGEKLIGMYDSDEDALSEGARLFGMQPFLVRRIQEREQEVCIPALALGILHAASHDHTAG
jgi:hypothetical protein